MTVIDASPPSVKGWCPGALRPMPSGDGLIVRIRISGGRLALDDLRAIAALGRRCGAGAFDLSQRANLQMRGISEATLPDVHDALRNLGLLPADAGSEQILNVVAPPLAGVDPDALIDARALVTQIEELLRSDRRLRLLPSKFGFVVDDGGALSTTSVDADIALEATRSHDKVEIALRLAGASDQAARVAPERAVEAAGALARAFLTLRDECGARRMRAAVAALGAEAVFAHAGLSNAPLARRAPAAMRNVLGAHPLGDAAFVGCSAPYGRWRADDLERLADRVDAAGGRALRLTPWRAILAPGLAAGRAASLAATLGRDNLIVDGADPRLAIAACPGAPECPSASVRTHEAADSFVHLFAGAGPGLHLHVAGCEKGCAHPRPAPLTLVGRGGRFELVLHGAPGAPPVATGFDLAGAHCALAQRMRHVPPP